MLIRGLIPLYDKTKTKLNKIELNKDRYIILKELINYSIMSDTKVVQVFRAMKVILEMLEFRGYNVDSYKNYNLETIRHKVEESGEDYLESPLNIYTYNEKYLRLE